MPPLTAKRSKPSKSETNPLSPKQLNSAINRGFKTPSSPTLIPIPDPECSPAATSVNNSPHPTSLTSTIISNLQTIPSDPTLPHCASTSPPATQSPDPESPRDSSAPLASPISRNPTTSSTSLTRHARPRMPRLYSHRSFNIEAWTCKRQNHLTSLITHLVSHTLSGAMACQPSEVSENNVERAIEFCEMNLGNRGGRCLDVSEDGVELEVDEVAETMR
eukprot:GHVN01031115.1.p1 GENE.GHVN01031115.1~~GHVN01031115.1.p1  ORF type:complete len:219 (-),score=66.98 GHVN01031115.1:1177-1833(-)